MASVIFPAVAGDTALATLAAAIAAGTTSISLLESVVIDFVRSLSMVQRSDWFELRVG
jgi:hypothetical protein